MTGMNLHAQSPDTNDVFDKIPLNQIPPIPKSRLDVVQNRNYVKNVVPVKLVNKGNFLEKGSITINLGNGSTQFEQRKIAFRSIDDYTWFGESSDSTIIRFVVKGDNVTGSINKDTSFYRLTPLGKAFHVFSRVDPLEMAYNDTIRGRSSKSKSGINTRRERTVVQSSQHTEQDLLVLYTDDVATEVEDPEGLTQSAVEDVNFAYQNSGINVDMNLVHAAEVNYAESGTTSVDLEQLKASTDTVLNEAHDWRRQYKGDLVVMLVRDTQSDDEGLFTGEAYEIFADSTTAFAVVRYDYAAAPSYTLAHELGHLQGADHNPGDEVNPYKPYGHGMFRDSSGWRTIMSYNVNGCCSKIGYFSTPNVTYEGSKLGREDENFNVKVINETSDHVAGFLPPSALEVAIEGPSFVKSDTTVQWKADISGGISPYRVIWYRRRDSSSEWSNPVSDSSTYSAYVDHDFQLKVEVEGQRNDEVTSNTFYIYSGTDDSSTDFRTGISDLPKTYELSQNYPNPFNPSTKLSYTLPEPAKVKITLFDISGRKVRTMLNRYRSPGSYSFTFHAKDLSSGLYLMRMEAERESKVVFNKTIKMTLLK